MDIIKIIKPLGILTYLLVLATIISGLLRIKMKNHKLLAFTAIALATIHAALVLIYF